jgi:hypothetical protein
LPQKVPTQIPEDPFHCRKLRVPENGNFYRREVRNGVSLKFDPRGRYLDITGGYGLLTRAMRDFEFDF